MNASGARGGARARARLVSHRAETDDAPVSRADDSLTAGLPAACFEVTPMCRLCNERRPAPSRVRASDYRCARCIHRSPNGCARRARYVKGPKRQAVVRRSNQRRVFVGSEYHSSVGTAALALSINDFIKEKRRGFVARFAHGKEAQSAPAR